MKYNEYRKIICATPATPGLEYEIAVMWLNPGRLPIGVVSLNGCTDTIIRVPAEEINPHGDGKNTVPVIAVAREAFAGNTDVTDIMLGPDITRIGSRAFAGCTALERITIPKGVTRFYKGTFENCVSLKDIYYEGTREEWEKIEKNTEKREIEFGRIISGTPVHEITAERLIRIPGNEALVLANIHFRCAFPKKSPEFFIRAGKKDITGMFGTM